MNLQARSVRISLIIALVLVGLFISFIFYRKLGNPAVLSPDISHTSSDCDRIPCIADVSLLPGMKVTRKMGPMVFVIELAKETATVSVTANLGETSVSGLVMTAAEPSVTFKVADGQRSASGSLGAFFCNSTTNSHVVADFAVNDQARHRQNPGPTIYRGDLVRWSGPEQRVLDVFSVFITPDLEVRAELIDDQTSGTRMSAQVTFYYGDQVVDSYLVMSTSTVVDTKKATVGNVRIDPGGTITFRPATSMQKGQINLDISVGAVNPESSVQYSGTLGEWSWVQGRGSNCGG